MEIGQAIRWSAQEGFVAGGLRRLARGCGRWLSAALRRMARARMVSVLSRLSDGQLAQIGIRRSDIPSHAHRLIYGAERRAAAPRRGDWTKAGT